MDKMPKWADVILTPLISLVLAMGISALVILAIGESPWMALTTMVEGALGSSYGWGFTLYYATNFIFTGLAVMVAYHAALFNIGGEGQAAMGGLGVALVLLAPLIAMRFTDEVNWTAFDFAFAAVLLIGAGLLLELILWKARGAALRAGLSSMTMQSAGGRPSRSAASRNRSGAGLPRATSVAE